MIRSGLIIFCFLLLISNLSAGLLIDDFNDGNLNTLQNKVIGKWEGNGGSGAISTDPNNGYGNYGRSFKIEYSGCSRGSSGWVAIVLPLDTTVSYTSYNCLAFQVKGEASAADDGIAIGFGDGSERMVNLSEYLAHGITRSWQKVVIPLAGLSTNLKNMQEIKILMKPDIDSGSGTIYLDNIILATNSPGRLIIDNFHDTGPYNTFLGYSWVDKWAGSSGTNNYLQDSTGTFPDHYVLQLLFNKTSGGGFLYKTLPSGAGLTITEYDRLHFYARQESVQGNLTNMNIVINDGANRSVNLMEINEKPLRSNWQEYSISLTNFINKGMDPSWISYFHISIENWYGSTNARLYLNDITLLADNYAADTTPPQAPSSVKLNGIPIAHYAFFDPTNGNTMTAVGPTLASDGTMESIRFEYRPVNTHSWKLMGEDFSLADNSYVLPSLWTPPVYNMIFDVRVTAMDVYGNISSSAVYKNCQSGHIFDLGQKTISSAVGGLLRDISFNYFSIPPLSFRESQVSFKIGYFSGANAGAFTVKDQDFSVQNGTEINFISGGITLEPADIYFTDKIKIGLKIPSLPAGTSKKELTIYYWDNGTWLQLASKIEKDEWNNELLTAEFDRSGRYIIATKSLTGPAAIEEIQNFYMSEKILTPNDDGFNDIITFSFITKLDNTDRVDYKITDINGNVIREAGVQPNNNQVLFSWDGRDNDGDPADPGLYLICISTRSKSIKAGLTVIR